MAIIFCENGVRREMKSSDILVQTRSEEELLDLVVVIKRFQSEYKKLKLNKIKTFSKTGSKLGKLAVIMAREYMRLKLKG